MATPLHHTPGSRTCGLRERVSISHILFVAAAIASSSILVQAERLLATPRGYDAILRQCSLVVDRHRTALAECAVARELPPKVTCNCFCPTCIPDGYPDVATLTLCTTPPPVTTMPLTVTAAPTAKPLVLPAPPPLSPLPVLPPLAQEHLPTLGPFPTFVPTTTAAPTAPAPAHGPAMALLAYAASSRSDTATAAAIDRCRAAEKWHREELIKRGCDKRGNFRRLITGGTSALRRIMPSNCNCQCAPCDSWAPPPAAWQNCRTTPTPPDPPPPPKPTTPAPPTNGPPNLPPIGTEYLPTLRPLR